MPSISRIQKSGDRPRTSLSVFHFVQDDAKRSGRRSGALDAHDETAAMTNSERDSLASARYRNARFAGATGAPLETPARRPRRQRAASSASARAPRQAKARDSTRHGARGQALGDARIASLRHGPAGSGAEGDPVQARGADAADPRRPPAPALRQPAPASTPG